MASWTGKMPRFVERCRQLTEARAENPWLAEGSVIVQQQAIKDHQQAMANFFAGTYGAHRGAGGIRMRGSALSQSAQATCVA